MGFISGFKGLTKP